MDAPVVAVMEDRPHAHYLEPGETSIHHLTLLAWLSSAERARAIFIATPCGRDRIRILRKAADN
jgi:hypothetical protein